MNTHPMTETAIARLIEGFENSSLTREEWTHEAHLIMAAYYLYHLTEYEAIARIRNGIHLLNAAMGVVSSPTSGYHETITLFYAYAIGAFLEQICSAGTIRSFPECVAALLQSEIAQREYPLRFYTKERLFSIEARAVWCEPDKEEFSWVE